MPAPIKLGKINFSSLSLPEQLQMSRMIDAVNALGGYSGDIELQGHLSLSGHQIKNVAPPTEGSDVVTSDAAEAKYSAAALRPQLESSGSTPFVGYRQMQNGSQREKSSTWLNNLLSTPPNSNNINPIVSSSGGSTTVTIPASVLQMGDGTTRYLPSRTDTLSNPANYSISTFSTSGNVATIVLTTAPSPAFSTSTVVFISGTGQIDGAFLVASVVNPTTLTINVSTLAAGTGGNLSVGGANYYYLDNRFNKVMLSTFPAGADTPFNRLGVSNDSYQLLAVVNINSGGAIQDGVAGGGTPTTVSTANAGSRF